MKQAADLDVDVGNNDNDDDDGDDNDAFVSFRCNGSSSSSSSYIPFFLFQLNKSDDDLLSSDGRDKIVISCNFGLERTKN